MTAIEGRARQSEGNELRLGAACKLSYWSECLGKNASAEPSTKDGLRLFVSMPSLLQAHPSIDTVS